MTHSSPAVFGLWSVTSALLSSFCFYHLWSYDRFRCLRWKNSGPFKRLMTYTYISTLPLITAYSVGNAIIKYNEGFIDIPNQGIIPVPYTLWRPAYQKASFPLVMLFSFGWSFEMTTHLEELCFWLFLINASSSRQDWFHSLYFRIWCCGSFIALIYVPLTTILTRSDPLRCEAATFLAGSLGSFVLTLCFIPVLYTFPSFLANLERDGVDETTATRLKTFDELNRIRVLCRFFFVVPLIVLGVDGVRPHHHVNESMFWRDFLSMVAAFGCLVQSSITLLIFFPRSTTLEYQRYKAKQQQQRSGFGSPCDSQEMDIQSDLQITVSAMSSKQETHSYASKDDEEYQMIGRDLPPAYLPTWKQPMGGSTNDPTPNISINSAPLAPLRPNRRDDERIEPIRSGQPSFVSLRNSDFSPRKRGLNPWIKNFRSPIDLVHRRR